MTVPLSDPADRTGTLPGAIGWMLLGWLCLTLFLQAVLEDPQMTAAFVSPMLGDPLLSLLGGHVAPDGFVTVPFDRLGVLLAAAALVCWSSGAAVIAIAGGRSWQRAFIDWGRLGGAWWGLTGIWYVCWLISTLAGVQSAAAMLGASAEMCWALCAAGWLTTLITLVRPGGVSSSRSKLPGWVWVAMGIGVYTAVFGWMNWQLYAGLRIPHGDSAMYEEHLWNILHGKGFRSYLDQGLFLGEHIQVIHLALLPLYVLWPSHLLLELCESFALALTALPMYWIVRRHTESERVGVWMAWATLLYFPLQYLDIAIDLKTFRPISFGVPLLLLAIDQMERRRWKSMTALLIATLSAKEDFAIVMAPLGVWLAVTSWWQHRQLRATIAGDSAATGGSDVTLCRLAELRIGLLMAVLSTAYLLLAVKVVIPWFRDGETVHYARYFSQFGDTPTAIVLGMMTRPHQLLGELLTAGTLLYALRVLLPLGGTPLLSPTRLLIGGPLFILLCLNELAQETPAPVHHFHAPLLPILFWSAAAGIGLATRCQIDRPCWTGWRWAGRLLVDRGVVLARFATLCALTTGLVVSIHPLSRKFWDAGDALYWRTLYIPGERAARFADVLPLVPPTARVASTDFVHPRFTHHDRSYDYSGYLRKVAGYQQRVPEDTEYIVIDTRHPYSTMHAPQDVPEFHDDDQWELLTHETDPWFIVLKRRTPADP